MLANNCTVPLLLPYYFEVLDIIRRYDTISVNYQTSSLERHVAHPEGHAPECTQTINF